MFVRHKKNKSGSVSIVVVDKSHGKFNEIKSFGAAKEASKIAELEEMARKWISEYLGQLTFDFDE